MGEIKETKIPVLILEGSFFVAAQVVLYQSNLQKVSVLNLVDTDFLILNIHFFT